MTAIPPEQTCGTTGLRLVAARAETAFRVAKDRRGALNVQSNTIVGPLPYSADPVDRRGRFDTIGSTIYLADSRACAYAEVLIGFRKERAAIAKVAESIAWDADEYIAQVIADARANGVDVPWSITVDWQMDRSLYEVQLPGDGWWVKIDHVDTITALENLAPTVPGMTEQVKLLTSGAIESENRDLTTLLAQVIREQQLFDGSEPLGIYYQSKTLMGRCWAYWDRRADAGLAPSGNDLVHVGTSIIERRRLLSGNRRANAIYTVDSDEPANAYTAGIPLVPRALGQAASVSGRSASLPGTRHAG